MTARIERQSRLVPRLMLASLLLAAAAPAATPPTPESTETHTTLASRAVTYLEHGEGGRAATGRLLDRSTGGAARFAIDVNSWVEVKVNEPKLQEALAPYVEGSEAAESATDLVERIRSLRAIASSLQATVDNLEALRKEVPEAEAGATWTKSEIDAVRARVRTHGTNVGRLLRALADAIAHRLESAGNSKEEADAGAERILDERVYVAGGYRWDEVAALFNEETRIIQEELAALENAAGLGVEIQAHLVRGGTVVGPVYLRGHNEAPTAPARPFVKHETAPSEATTAAHEEYAKLAADVGDAENAGEALLSALRAEIKNERAKLDGALAGLAGALDRAEKVFNQAKLDSVASKSEFLRTLRDTLESLRRLSTLRSDMRGEADPGRLLSRVVTTVGAVEPREILGMLDPGAWDEARVALEGDESATQAIEDLRLAVLAFPNWFRTVLVAGPAETAADLVVPIRRQLSEDLDTEFHLQTLPHERKPGDAVELTYRFFRGQGDKEEKLGIGWKDRFELRVFGWQSRVVASLGFTRRDVSAEEVWKPTALMSWIAKFRSWPREATDGLRPKNWWQVGVGLSTMILDFEEEESTELGLGVTFSFLDERLLAGYGTNLQADNDEDFAFFAIRIFSPSGVLDPVKNEQPPPVAAPTPAEAND